MYRIGGVTEAGEYGSGVMHTALTLRSVTCYKIACVSKQILANPFTRFIYIHVAGGAILKNRSSFTEDRNNANPLFRPKATP